MFTVTPPAAAEILAAAQRSQAAGMALRVAARRASDGSIDYGMGFDEPHDADAQGDFGGLTVLIGPDSQALLDGTVLDFVEIEPQRFDFIFIPPGACSVPEQQARGGCGSGGCQGCGGSAG